MKKSLKVLTLAFLTGAVLLSGCTESKKNVFEQAGKDLDQNYYQYALEGYLEVIQNEELLPESYRGLGITLLKMGRYSDAADALSNALAFPKQAKTFTKDVLSYRATAYAKEQEYDLALEDCQTLKSEYTVDSNTCFLTGMVELYRDSYEEATSNFDQAYAAKPSYEMALRIYQVYVEKGMEADGTRYLEKSLDNQPKTPADYCDRGRVYYYMQDYEHAKNELTTSSNNGNKEALLLLGMVYMELGDISNSRSMYNQYITQVGETGKGYNGLAQCDMMEDKFQDALDKIAKGLEVATTEEMQDLLHNEIVIYEKQLDFATALQKAKEYIALFPDDTVIRREIVFLESRTQNAVHYDEAPAEIPETAEGTSEEYIDEDIEEYVEEDVEE